MPSFTLPTSTPPASGTGGYGLTQAHQMVRDVHDMVEDRLREAVSDADTMRNQALSALDQLTALDLNLTIPDAPEAPEVGIDFDFSAGDISPVGVQDFGEVSFQPPTAPALDAIQQGGGIAIPDFQPSVGGISIPDAPALPSFGQLPDEPVLADVEFPDSPVLTLPGVPALDEITLPAFNEALIPELTAGVPEFEESPISAVFNWAEPTYSPVVMEEVLAVIRRMWDGGLGIPAAVENAMWERALDQEDVAVSRAVSEAFNEHSSRGFTTPTGMLARRTDAIRAEGERRKAGLRREITIEVAKTHVENARFAVTNGIAAENVYFNIHTNAAQRLFEAEKARVELRVTVYNAMVAVYNARIERFKAEVGAYSARLQVILDTFKARLAAETARGELNAQRVQIYSEQIRALVSTIAIYEAEVRAASAKTEAVRNTVDVYRARLQGYAEQVNAAKLPFDVYKIRVDAETAKTGIIDAEARSYAALVSGRVSAAEVQAKYAQLTSMGNEQRISQYSALLDGEKARMQAQLGTIQALADAYKADVGRYEAEVRRETAIAETEMQAHTSAERVKVANFEARVKEYQVQMELITQRSAQMLESIKAAGSISATLAAGAMAGINVGASVSGSGQTVGSGSSSYNESLSFQQGISESISQSITQDVS